MDGPAFKHTSNGSVQCEADVALDDSPRVRRFLRLEAQTLTIQKDRQLLPEILVGLGDAEILAASETLRFAIRSPAFRERIQIFVLDKANFVPMAELMDLASKTSLENFYTILIEPGAVLGQGTFGKVVKCVDRETSELYALKVVRKVAANEANLKFLMREVHIMRQLAHPNLVRAVDIFDRSDSLSIVMDLVPGGTLFDVLAAAGRPLPEPHTRQCLHDVLRGVKCLHLKKIVHRDIKLGNVLVRSKSFPYGCVLADFGLSNILGADNTLLSAVGTPEYVPPEIVLGNRYGEKVDVWACGVVLFNMLTAKYPFQGTDNDQTLLKVVESNRWEDELGKMSEDAAGLCREMLCREERERISVDEALLHPFFDDLMM